MSVASYADTLSYLTVVMLLQAESYTRTYATFL